MTLFKSRIERRKELTISLIMKTVFLVLCLNIFKVLGKIWWTQFYIDIRYTILATIGIIFISIIILYVFINIIITIDVLTTYLKIYRWLDN